MTDEQYAHILKELADLKRIQENIIEKLLEELIEVKQRTILPKPGKS